MTSKSGTDRRPGVRSRGLPYGRQAIDENDVSAVAEVLRSDWLTTGPKVQEFERSVAEFVGAKEGVAVSSGTAALHCAAFAAGIGPGDEVITTPLTFVASANCVLYQGGTPVFADVEPDTLLLDPAKVEEKITRRTKAIIAVDYGGQPCDYDALRDIAAKHKLLVIADACHALGATYKSRRVGSLADLTVFSFHPVKHITTGEGGMITTDNEELALRMRMFRNHGIESDFRQREKRGTWEYDMVALGCNYRLTDFQCALGLSQMKKLPEWIQRRQKIASRYDRAFASPEGVVPLARRQDRTHAYHLYVVRIDEERFEMNRGEVFIRLRGKGIGVNVHYRPVYLHSYYREHLETGPRLCAAAEQAYDRVLSLPMFPAMSDADVDRVIEAIGEVREGARRWNRGRRPASE